jgi:hypothetical protein
MAGVGDFKALLRDLVFVLITIHSSALFKIYLYTLRYRDILDIIFFLNGGLTGKGSLISDSGI